MRAPRSMKISKKAEYAFRALAAMGRAPVGTTFSIQEISSNERMPLKVLEQILVVLKNGGILRSKRGVGGGYQLTLQPSHIKLRDVVVPFDGAFEPIGCTVVLEKSGASCECGVPGGCSLARTFGGLRDVVRHWLETTTIADIIANDPPHEAMSFEI